MQTTDITGIWNDVLEIVRGEIKAAAFKTWFMHTVPTEFTDDGVFVVGVQNEFARNWLEERYSQRLSAALRQVVGADVSVRIVVDRAASFEHAGEAAPADQHEPQAPPLAEQAASAQTAPHDDEFDPKFTFDSFVVGDSNHFARNVALAVAERPGLPTHNPLFIWGGPGLGKTHLLQAIAHYVHDNFPHKKIMYVSSEQFTNEFVDSINLKNSDTFRQKYRSVDLLLIDDIQFLEKKLGMQEQFFNTFNELHRYGKQIVLASDRPPKDINMEERYLSRFAWGLLADVQPPNFETRLAILRQYAESQDIPIDNDVLSYIAEVSTPNIREMEGAINRLAAHCCLFKLPVVTLDVAKPVLKDLFPEHSNRPIPIATIQREVCRYFGVGLSDLVGNKRSQVIVYPRQIAMYLARELTDLSLPKIGAEFGGRDHTTVIHANGKIQNLMKNQRDVFSQIQQLTNIIKQKS